MKEYVLCVYCKILKAIYFPYRTWQKIHNTCITISVLNFIKSIQEVLSSIKMISPHRNNNADANFNKKSCLNKGLRWGQEFLPPYFNVSQIILTYLNIIYYLQYLYWFILFNFRHNSKILSLFLKLPAFENSSMFSL